MYIVYILKSILFNRYYTGSTENLKERLIRHNQGRSKWTKKYRPWEIVYIEKFVTRSEAVKREKQIKSYKGGSAFKKLLTSAGIV